ncbi:MAG: adenosylcobinamide-GDP ribazoletransferase [Trueperaceae bacterium]
MIRGLLSALAFMTTLPLPATASSQSKHTSASVRAYPLVGLVLGLLLLSAFLLLSPLPPLVRAVLTVGLWLLLTGALHFDGFCDVADASFASKTPGERQRIAKDAAIGSFALAAGTVLLLSKVALLSHLEQGAWLVVTLVLSRTTVTIPMALHPVHRSSRLGRSARPRPRDLVVALLLGVGLSGLWSWFLIDLSHWLIALVSSSLATVLLAAWIAQRMEGLGGDAYGTLIEVAESVILLAALAMGSR